MSNPKEPNHFATDFAFGHEWRREAAYRTCFPGLRDGILAGEATATYFWSEVALRNIMERNPDAKVIVLLRNPIDAAAAFHRNLKIWLSEDIDDFEMAWRAQDDRLAGLRVPRANQVPLFLQYREIYSYSIHIERLFKFVPLEKRMILIYEEEFTNPAALYRKVLNFLGIEDDGRTDFPRVNGAHELRSRRFASIYVNPPQILRRSWRAFRRATGTRNWLLPLLLRINERPVKPQPLAPAFRAELTRIFSSDVARCEALLGRSLDIWKDWAPERMPAATDAYSGE